MVFRWFSHETTIFLWFFDGFPMKNHHFFAREVFRVPTVDVIVVTSVPLCDEDYFNIEDRWIKRLNETMKTPGLAAVMAYPLVN